MADFEANPSDLGTRKGFIEALGRGITDALLLSDDQGNIISYNQGAKDLLEYSGEGLGACRISDIFPLGLPDEFSILDAALGRSLGQGRRNGQLCEVRTKGNRSFIAQVMTTCMTDPGQKSTETVIIIKKAEEISIFPAGGVAETGGVSDPETDGRLQEELQESRADLQKLTQQLQSTQAQLRQYRNMATVGQLVSGVAHEMSNALMGIYGCAQMALKESHSSRGESNLLSLIEETRRAISMTRNLLSFSRSNGYRKQPVMVNEIISATLDLKTYDLQCGNIAVVTDFDADIAETLADANQLQQVFLNLVINAEQAMGEGASGCSLHISTAQVEESIRIVFSNTGPQIPVDIMDRIFDPFFTTKEVDQGTGLGLSICHGIIEDHGGKISVRNDDGGVTFTIELPVTH